MRRSFLLPALLALVLSLPAHASSYTFTSNLFVGSRGPDVYVLQQVLNRDSATLVASSGSGSPGQETSYFGLLTRAAVMRFQEKYASSILVPAGLSFPTGFVGFYTRQVLNSLLAGSGGTPPVTTPPTTPPGPPVPAPPGPPIPAPPPGPPGTSASGTTIPSASQIVDGGGNVWTVANSIIYRNHIPVSYSSTLLVLLYYSGSIYQENTLCSWWVWSGASWISTANPSPGSTGSCSTTPPVTPPGATSASGTTIPSASQIVDSQSNVWTESDGIVYRNNVALSYSSTFTLLLYYSGSIYQENSSCQWWVWSGSSWTSTSNPSPSSVPSCTPPVQKINGSCGSAGNSTVSSAPTSNLCSAGSASSVSGSGPWSWTCLGSGGGTTVACVALKGATSVTPPSISAINPSSGPETPTLDPVISGSNFEQGAQVYFNGIIARGIWQDNCGTTCIVTLPPLASSLGAVDVKVVNPDGGSATLHNGWTYTSSSGGGGGGNGTDGSCGSANGTTVSSAPTSGLCSAGTASSVNGSGPWSWSCSGSNGGSTASCSASKSSSGGGGGGGGGGSSTTGFPHISAMWIGGQQTQIDTQVSRLAKFDTLILAFWPGYRTSNGGTLEQTLEKIKAINPSELIFLYVNDGELTNTATPPGGAYNAMWQKISQMGWWAYNNGSGGSITLSDFGYPNFNRINNTTFTPPDSSGKDWVQWYAQWLKDTYYTPNPSIEGFFIDNTQWYPRVNADWNRDGTTDSASNPTVQQWLRQGYQQYFNTMHQILPGHLQTGNSDCYQANAVCPEYNQLLNGSLFEGAIGFSWSPETWGGWGITMASYHKAMNLLAAPKIGMFAQVGSGSDYQSVRYGLASALMDNGYYIYDSGGENSPYGDAPWFDEYDDGGHLGTGYLGQPLSGPVTSSYQNGVYRRDFEHGIVLVNPKGNGAQTVSLGGTFRKLSGTQSSVNNGASVTSVTLQDRDGIILLK